MKVPIAGAGTVLLFLRTVQHLRPAQVGHRLRLRTQRVVVRRFPGAAAARFRRPVPSEPGWPEPFVPIDGSLAEGFPSVDDNGEGTFRFLGQTRSLGTPRDWHQSAAEQLWRYHLHYFEWAWSFAAHTDRMWARETFASLWESWSSCTSLGDGDGWSPYAGSLRAWVLCGVYRPLVAGTSIETRYLAQLAMHAGFLEAHRELDVGGNHLVKNLKALIGLGVFLQDEALTRSAVHQLEEQVLVQVLADGGHYERSPSYHCQVLGDLIDIRELLVTAGRTCPPTVDHAIGSMRRWLGAMLLPDGDVPVFNDCTRVGERRLTLLDPTAPTGDRMIVLQPSGYVVMRPDDTLHVVADVGPPCPSELPAHAHADCLSFEIAVRGERVVVDTGTSTYQGHQRRTYERSTAAHNTVEVDGANQTEVWGTFRAARRAMPLLETAVDEGEVMVVIASHDGYERLPGQPRHRRTWRVSEGLVEIIDDIDGSGSHTAVSSLHFASGLHVRDGHDALHVGPLLVTASSALSIQPAEVATDFGSLATGLVVRAEATGTLPLRLSFCLRVEEAP